MLHKHGLFHQKSQNRELCWLSIAVKATSDSIHEANRIKRENQSSGRLAWLAGRFCQPLPGRANNTGSQGKIHRGSTRNHDTSNILDRNGPFRKTHETTMLRSPTYKEFEVRLHKVDWLGWIRRLSNSNNTHVFCIAVVKVCINHAQITDAVQMNFSNSANCIFFPETAQINNTQSKASRYTLAISLTLVACAGLIFAMQTSSSIPSHWSYWFYPDHKHKRKSSK